MIDSLARNQNWAKVAPWAGIFFTVLLFANFFVYDPHFWGLINIPLYLFHQTEEHYVPGGFKDFMNRTVMALPQGQEKLTDIKIFWINILMVWLAFAVFGALSFKHKSWNLGLVMASIQFVISLFAAYYVTVHGLDNPIAWWLGTIIFSIVAHILLFKLVMTRD
ncbi:hypothetical protein DR79_1242 [Francisella tularensis]|nr:hypothetical membrane protein [Francisella tularensis subsp. tularensis WY96-3418]AFB78873.1 hypothetical protein FTU_0797 [Francisella tularensis subsp. tularensis TIGB03]AFB80418.1 hypothetical protein FTV_0713 [Francisella tularensis subsp. tularensis TI0902]AJI63424.1 hypothetical protein CH65_1088 [Francisella tularensis subsp. tularensis]AJI70029.1 hypothetical protein BZ14_47 [Francisella tularensis subsp. tularensis SCHU S4]AKE20388.1 hypothetical protein RO31_0866 [Francisella tula